MTEAPSNLPFVSCLCPTADRRDFIERAIECFQWQSYPSSRRELVLLDDGIDAVADVVATYGQGTSSIRYHYEAPKAALGPKRNRLVELAKADAEILVLWDDDDWHGPDRVTAQVAAIIERQARLCLLDKVRVQDQAGVVWEQANGGWTFPGTLAFRRSVWTERRFPNQDVGADRDFLAKQRLTTKIDGTLLYRVIRHGRHRTSFEPTGWIKRPDVRSIDPVNGL